MGRTHVSSTIIETSAVSNMSHASEKHFHLLLNAQYRMITSAVK